MCGVVGIIRYDARSTTIDEDEIVSIRDNMINRGPDGKGVWISQDKKIALAHRRLEIIGLGEQGIQPMLLNASCVGNSGKLAISYNGEIYNYKELRIELETLGHKFKSNTDTEVILHLYEQFGDGFQTKLRGMFAFILHDSNRSETLLIRDPLGIKPLYYHDKGGIITVASQAKAMLKSNRISKATSDAALAALFILGSIPEPLTAWCEIKAVPAGTIIKIKNDGIKDIKRYYSLANEIEKVENLAHSEFILDTFTSELYSDVKAHLTSDVDVGVFLSSGIDSSAILGLASQASPNLHSVTLGFQEFEGLPSDEVPLASQVSRLYNSQHTIHKITGTEFTKSLPSFLSDMDQPSIDGLNTWLVARATAETGLKVALSGIGGDEFFGGYSTFTSVPSLFKKTQLLNKFYKSGRLSRHLLAPIFKVNRPKAAGIFEYGDTLERMWFLNRCVQGPWELPSILGKDRAHEATSQLNIDEILEQAEPFKLKTDVGKIAALEGGLYMKNQLLRDADWAGMGHSLEIRVPFVDSFFLPIMLTRLIYDWTPETKKSFLSQIPNPRIPDSVVDRGKTGFGLPMDKWISTADDYATWKLIPTLAHPKCSWAKRWAYVVASHFDMI